MKERISLIWIGISYYMYNGDFVIFSIRDLFDIVGDFLFYICLWYIELYCFFFFILCFVFIMYNCYV